MSEEKLKQSTCSFPHASNISSDIHNEIKKAYNFHDRNHSRWSRGSFNTANSAKRAGACTTKSLEI